MTMLLRSLARLIFGLSLFQSFLLKAESIHMARTVMESGDYIYHPGVQLAWSQPSQRVRLDVQGQSFGAYRRIKALLGWDYALELLPWSEVQTYVGVSLLDQYTAYHPAQGASSQEHDLNLGLNLGWAWNLYHYERWTLRATWDSHLFAAGLAFVLLTTARENVLGLGVEMSL